METEGNEKALRVDVGHEDDDDDGEAECQSSALLRPADAGTDTPALITSTAAMVAFDLPPPPLPSKS